MSPKKNDPAAAAGGASEYGGLALTAGDVKMIDAVLKNCGPGAKPSPAQVNWEKIAQDLEFKNIKVAQTRFGQVCKKYHWFGDQGGQNQQQQPVTPSSSPRKPAARRSAAKRAMSPVSDEDVDLDVEGATPTKKRKVRGAAAKSPKVKTEPEILDRSVSHDSAAVADEADWMCEFNPDEI
ncbi:hypothetical protein AAE478_001843 [Parahypoxylon ruwenzoriense]